MKISHFSSSNLRIARSVIAVLVPFLAFAIQVKFWTLIQPFVWFLFYPAVFTAG
jgi:hypothetical protein